MNDFAYAGNKCITSVFFFKILSPSMVRKCFTAFLLEKIVGYNDMITRWIVSDSGTDVSSGFSLMRFIIDTFVLYFHDIRLRSFVMDVRI